MAGERKEQQDECRRRRRGGVGLRRSDSGHADRPHYRTADHMADHALAGVTHSRTRSLTHCRCIRNCLWRAQLLSLLIVGSFNSGLRLSALMRDDRESTPAHCSRFFFYAWNKKILRERSWHTDSHIREMNYKQNSAVIRLTTAHPCNSNYSATRVAFQKTWLMLNSNGATWKCGINYERYYTAILSQNIIVVLY